MNTKGWAKTAAVGFLLAASPMMQGATTGAERLERGVNLQKTDGDLDAAIKEFESVLRTDEKSKKLAAEARYRLAECYQAKGNTKLVRQHVNALRKDFAAENRWVQKAAKLLPVETEFQGSPWTDGKAYHYDVKLKNGRTVGKFVFAERRDPNNDGVIEGVAIRTAGMVSLSRSRFQDKGFQPLDCRWYIRSMANSAIVYEPGGLVKISDAGTGEELDTYDHGQAEGGDPLYDNEQLIQLVRTLNQEVGSKQETVLIAAMNGAAPIEFDMEVTEHVDVEVPVGNFPCAKIETNIKQTFFISRDDSRKIVKLDMGMANLVLVKEFEWDWSTVETKSSEKFGFSFEVPGPMLSMDPVDNGDVYRLQMWSGDFAGHDGLLEVNWTKNLVEKARESSRAFADVRIENAAKNFDRFEVLEGSWEKLEIAGVDAVACQIEMQSGEITEHEYGVLAVGEEKSIAFHLNYAKPDAEIARARALEILESIKWAE